MRRMFKFSVNISWQTPLSEPDGACKFMDSSATNFVDEFWYFSVVLLVLGRPERLSSSTDTRPALKCECHLKPAVALKKVLQKPNEAFHGGGFTEFHAKLDADTLLNFAIHRRQHETRSRKSNRVKKMRVHSAVSRGRLMQLACRSVTFVSPLIFFHRGTYYNKSAGTFRHKLVPV
jgi:hypothetical protein